MKKMAWGMGIMLMASLGIPGTAFAKHHRPFKKEDIQDHKEDQGRKVPCLVHGVQQMVRSEGVCKDFDGTVVTDKSPQGGTAVPKGKITEQKIQDK